MPDISTSTAPAADTTSSNTGAWIAFTACCVGVLVAFVALLETVTVSIGHHPNAIALVWLAVMVIAAFVATAGFALLFDEGGVAFSDALVIASALSVFLLAFLVADVWLVFATSIHHRNALMGTVPLTAIFASICGWLWGQALAAHGSSKSAS